MTESNLQDLKLFLLPDLYDLMPVMIAVISFFTSYVVLTTTRLSQFVLIQLRIKYADLRTFFS